MSDPTWLRRQRYANSNVEDWNKIWWSYWYCQPWHFENRYISWITFWSWQIRHNIMWFQTYLQIIQLCEKLLFFNIANWRDWQKIEKVSTHLNGIYGALSKEQSDWEKLKRKHGEKKTWTLQINHWIEYNEIFNHVTAVVELVASACIHSQGWEPLVRRLICIRYAVQNVTTCEQPRMSADSCRILPMNKYILKGMRTKLLPEKGKSLNTTSKYEWQTEVVLQCQTSAKAWHICHLGNRS